jgi:hypothetical protein
MQLEKTSILPTSDVTEDLPKDIPITQVMQGFKTWRNPKNRFLVGRLHYTVDPRKRTKEWRADARAGIPYAEWMREYEIVWSAFNGVPVYQDHYSKKFHVSLESLPWAMEYPVIRGWDFGLDTLGMACVFTQLISHSRLIVLNELVASDSDIDTFAEAVQRFSFEWFPGCKRYFDIVDPTGFNRNAAAKNKRSYTDAVRDICKAKPIPGEHARTARLKSVVVFLDGAVQGTPKIHVSGPDCLILVEGFDGGYHYPFAKDGQVKDVPEKNEHSHIQDALQMVCSRVMSIDLFEEDDSTPIVPRYNFGR